MNRLIVVLALIGIVCSLTGCAPEIGSDKWCENMLDKSKGDWTANEATEFARNCVFKTYDDE